MGIEPYKAITIPLMLFLLTSAGCSGCEDSIVQDDPDEPWILEEGELCALETPDEEFRQISETHWSRVLPIVHEECGDYQATLTIRKFSAERWSLKINSSICNRCAERRFVRGEAEGRGEGVAGASGFVGVLDEQKRRYMFGCNYVLGSLIETPFSSYQLDIDPGMMHQITQRIARGGIHPERLPDDFSSSPPYYDNPTDFSSELDLFTNWPYLRAVSDNDSSVTVDIVEAMCAEFLDAGAPYEDALESRETYYFEHVIGEPRFPEEFETFLHSRNFDE